MVIHRSDTFSEKEKLFVCLTHDFYFNNLFYGAVTVLEELICDPIVDKTSCASIFPHTTVARGQRHILLSAKYCSYLEYAVFVCLD